MFKDAQSRKSFFAGKKAANSPGQMPNQPQVVQGPALTLPKIKPIQPVEDEMKPKAPKFPRIQSMMKVPKPPRM